MNCVDWSDVESAAQDCAGNHRKFDSFAWHDRPDENDEHWTIVYTHNRDSGLIEQSNAEAIAQELEPFIESGDIFAEHHGHWACGWCDGYSIRVYRQTHLPADDGEVCPDENALEVTEAFRTWCYLQERLADYPVLDEEDFSRKEYDACIQAIESEGRRHIRDDAPKDWGEQVYSWLSHNDDEYPHELENRDGTGAYPSEESVRAALTDLEFLDATYQVIIDETVFLETDSKSKAEREFATLLYHASMGIGIGAGQRLCLLCDDDLVDDFDPNEKGA